MTIYQYSTISNGETITFGYSPNEGEKGTISAKPFKYTVSTRSPTQPITGRRHPITCKIGN